MRTNKTTNVTIRIDAQLKNDAEILFASLGLNFSAAINLFLLQCIREQAIPFRIALNPDHRMTRENISLSNADEANPKPKK